MNGIPPVLDTDVEDVAWALQTADALWKRNERGDALVWLRRAAQAAGEANDDDRALALARGAAELTEWIAQAPTQGSPAARAPAAATSTEPLTPLAPPVAPAPPSGENVPELLTSGDFIAADSMPTPVMPPVRPAQSPPPPSIGRDGPRVAVAGMSQPPPSARVLTAAEQHAGMLDPWSETEGPKRPPRPPPAARAGPRPAFEDEEVITSARPVGQQAAPGVSPSGRPPPPRPSPGVAPRPGQGAPLRPASRADMPAVKAPLQGHAPAQARVHPQAPAPPSGPPDLARIDAFADLPDEARSSVATGATMRALTRGKSVDGFALALVVSGSFEVQAARADASATSLASGAVLRAVGTLEARVPLRLVCTSDTGMLATWDDAGVAEAFATRPWVEDDLRAAADKVQALAGMTLGALGRPSYSDVRAALGERLALRVLAPGEMLASAEEPVPGLLVVCAGSVELVLEEKVEGTVEPGGFVFASQTLAGGRPMHTARAGAGGALVLAADRAITQELVATQPLLVELLGSG